MRSKEEIIHLIESAPYKEIEQKLNIQIRNGQTIQGIRLALKWVLKEPVLMCKKL